MRALLATGLALALALAAAAPHVHVEAQGAEHCTACVVRGGVEPASAQTPRVAPLDLPAGEVALAPAAAPVSGAPLGAVPGQSPPCA